MQPEVETRQSQQELVLDQIRDSVSREAIRQAIPSDRLVRYNFDSPDGISADQHLMGVLKRDGGNVYKYILGVASVARNPAQLKNSMGALAILEYHAQRHKLDVLLIDRAQSEFLAACKNPIPVSPGARLIQAEMSVLWSNQKGDNKDFIRVLKDRFSRGAKDYQPRDDQYWVEAYLGAILEPTMPIDLRKALIEASLSLSYGQNIEPRADPRFDLSASYVENVKPNWVFSKRGKASQESDPKDREIANLRATIKLLEARVAQGGLNGEAKRELEQLRIALRISAGKIEIYEQSGGHPLKVLEIGAVGWRSATPEQRLNLVKGAYRRLAKEHYYNLVPTDPKYDPKHAKLANDYFNRITNAFNFLKDLTTVDSF